MTAAHSNSPKRCIVEVTIGLDQLSTMFTISGCSKTPTIRRLINKTKEKEIEGSVEPHHAPTI
jgi:hypothetical protein